MKYLPIVVLALLVSTGCRSSRNQYEAYSPPSGYTADEAYVPPADYESSGQPVNYGGGVSAGASSNGSSCCH